MKLLAWRALAFLASSSLLWMTAGCASQGEGERCDQKNGNLDCESGLICGSHYVSGVYHSICCPPSGATVAACNAGGLPPTDSGLPTTDGAVDGRADTSDASTDPVSETAEDVASVDTRADTRADAAPDTSADMRAEAGPETGPPDASDAAEDSPNADHALDATEDTVSTDAPSEPTVDTPLDVAGEASIDAPLDIVIDVTDAADAPAADGPG